MRGRGDNSEGSRHPVGLEFSEDVDVFSRADHIHVLNRAEGDLDDGRGHILLGLMEAMNNSSHKCRVAQWDKEDTRVGERRDAVHCCGGDDWEGGQNVERPPQLTLVNRNGCMQGNISP